MTAAPSSPSIRVRAINHQPRAPVLANMTTPLEWPRGLQGEEAEANDSRNVEPQKVERA